MGCTSTAVIEQRRILPLPPQTVNSYIDKFPAIVLHKIKQKFYALADRQSKDLNHLDFMKLYSTSKINSQTVARLFFFFNDFRKQNLKFRQFMSKYATITKSQPSILFKIFFYIHKLDPNVQTLTRQEFQNFVRIQRQFFEKVPEIDQILITQQRFVEEITKAGFNVADYQNKLLITTEDDVPFQAINRELQDCEFNDYVAKTEYYLLSNVWFNRWSFYYQEADHTLDKSHIKSTKMLLSHQKSMTIKKRKKRESLNDSKRLNQSTLKSSQLGNALIQQPNTINFEDIEGEYKEELKQSLKASAQIKVITKSLWNLLCTLHPPQQEFKRIALSQDTIEFYPKSIYYSQAGHSGDIIITSQKIKQLSLYKQVSKLYQRSVEPDKNGKLGAFAKNFYEKNWREIQMNKQGRDLSLDPRLFVCFAQDRQSFIKNNYRKEITVKNLDIGDRVYTYFPYSKQVSEAVILSKCEEDKLKIHFKGNSFKYEIEVKKQELQIVQSDASLSAKKKVEPLIKGITNIGNTCFMNSIIQCLVATPVFDQFLEQFPFNPKKNPIGYGLSILARSLLKNQKCVPQDFKKVIDTHMPLFSGYDQHDAQQFLNLLLDKIAEQLQEKPTVIDYLFGGKAQSKLTCLSCQKQKTIDEKMYILSLPLPETQFNFYSIIIVPVTSRNLKKIIFRLHKDATVNDYVNAFEQRTGQNKKDYVFCQSSNNSLKKLKVQLVLPGYQRKKVTDLGIVPNISLIAFEKIPMKIYYDLLKQKPQNEFKDYQSSQTSWAVCRILDKKNDFKDKLSIQIINQESEIEKLKIDKDLIQSSITKLGNQTMQANYKKIILRKYNSALKKLQHFGMEFLIGIPRWASYNDIIALTQRYITNLKGEDAKLMRKNDKEKGAYIIRFLDPTKVRCIFCLKQNPMFNIDESDLQYCCDAFDKEIPIAWSCKYKSYWIYIDWIKFSACNCTYTSSIEIDTISKNVQLSRQEQFINLQDCIKLYNQNQKVQMECDSCKYKEQNLQHLIGTMPNILVLHMKEFRYTPEGHLIKLDLRLKWQEYLDASKFAFTSQGKLYELFAIVKHSGTSHSGHYTCIAKRKHPYQNKKVWINFDDDYTDQIKQEVKYIDDSYLLFYKKVDMPTSSLVIYSDLNDR